MTYQILARKWRPQKFTDVVGQNHIVSVITNGFLLNKIHHAYLFFGSRGVGKTTIARLFAKSLNCIKGITSIPCRKCKNCTEIERNCFTDLIEVDAASRTRVEDIKDLLDNVQYLPAHGKFKVYLIDEVHMLSKHSFNALLKTLEEPPEHSKFLLITTEINKLPSTILSRCLQLNLRTIDDNVILHRLQYILKKEKIDSELYALQMLAQSAHGSMRDALNLTDQAIILGNNKITLESVKQIFGILNEKQSLFMIESLFNADGKNLMKQVRDYASLGVDWDFILINMLSILHNLICDQIIPIQGNHEESDIITKLRYLIKKFSQSDIHTFYRILLIGRKELPFAPNYQIGVEITLLRALAFHPLTKRTITNITNENNITNNTCCTSSNITSFKNKYKTHQDTLTENDINKNINKVIVSKNMSISCKNIHTLSKKATNILEAREILLQKRENKNNRNTERLSYSKYSQDESLNKIMKRFSNINKYVLQQNMCKIDKTNQNTLQNLINAKIKLPKLNTINSKTKLLMILMKQAAKFDSWSSDIIKLSYLSLVTKKIIMHAWRENISTDKICLHVRPKYFQLDYKNTKIELQKTLSNYLSCKIDLTIKENNNLNIKTPMEWCKFIYKYYLSTKKNNSY